MQLIALKELPQGQQPGDLVEVPDAQGEVLVLVGAARVATAADLAAKAPAKDVAPRSPRRYQRRDLQAEE